MGAARKQPLRGHRITKRDVEILRFAGRTKLVTVDEVRTRFGMARSKAYARLRGLVGHGLLVHDRRVPGHGVYLATVSGLALAGLDLAPAAVSLGALHHDLAVARVVAQLEGEMPGLPLLTEREVRQHVHATGDETFRPRVTRRGMPDARHWPDLVLLNGDAEHPGWVAIEVELTRKSAERTRGILRGYESASALQVHHEVRSELWGVMYAVPTSGDARRIVELGKQVQLTASSMPVVLGVDVLDPASSIRPALIELIENRNAAETAQNKARAEREARHRAFEARQAAEAAAGAEELRRQQPERQFAAPATPAPRGLARVLGGGR